MTLYTDEKKKKERTGTSSADAARDSFSETDRKIAEQNPEYGERLAKIKQNYNNAQTDEERTGWHNEAEKLSRAYGYSRNADGTALTPLGAQNDSSAQRQNVKSNLETIKAFNDKYASGSDKNGYQAVINALLSDIAGAKFTYSAEDDPRYALAQEYARDAMNNQMAESAALSGGYGNSYAASAGQQVYDDYMEQAANNLEDRAYARFQDEQAERYNRLGLLRDLDDTLYSRSLNEREWDYMTDRDALADLRYDDETAYSRDRDALADSRYDREYTDSRADTAWNRRMTERQYADSRADELYIRALAQSADAKTEMDYEGLFTAALNDTYSPNTFIQNNYKKYGFSSSNGLIDEFEAWRDEIQGFKAHATVFLKKLGNEYAYAYLSRLVAENQLSWEAADAIAEELGITEIDER